MTFLKNLRLGSKLALGFGLCLALTAIVAFAGLTAVGKLQIALASMGTKQVPCVEWANQIDAMVTEYRVASDNLSAASDPAESRAYKADMAATAAGIDERFKKYEPMVVREVDVKNLKAAKSAWAAYHGTMVQLTEQFDKFDAEHAYKIMQKEAIPLYVKALKPATEKMIDLNHENAQKVIEATKGVISGARTTVLVAFGLAFLVGIGAALLVTRYIVSALRPVSAGFASLGEVCLTGIGLGMKAMANGDLTYAVTPKTQPLKAPSTDEVGKMAETFNAALATVQAAIHSYNEARGNLGQLVQDVALAAHQVQETSGGLAHATQEGGTASGEIAEASEKLATTATEANETMGGFATTIREIRVDSTAMAATAQAGRQAVANTIQAMERVQAQVATTSNKVGELNEKGEQIGKIVKTIEGIAEQTNFSR